MDTFEELGLQPALADALLAEGIEVPTSLQREAIPVLRKGNSALLRGGPGSGVMMAYTAPLLDRLEGGSHRPQALILTAFPSGAVELARSMARPAAAVGLRVAALDGGFAHPMLADILLGTPEGMTAAVKDGALKLDAVSALVLDSAAALLTPRETREWIHSLLEWLPSEDLQVIVVADPVTEEVRNFVKNRTRRAIFLPPDAGSEPVPASAAPIQRGNLRLRISDGDEESDLIALAGELLGDDVHHLLLFVRTEDRAADFGDLLTLHGYAAGAPGDPSSPIWLGLDPLEARKELTESPPSGEVVVVSVDVPADADELDRRHGASQQKGVVLAQGRELTHLRRTAEEAGYVLLPFPAPPSKDPFGLREFFDQVESTLEGPDLGPYHHALEPLFSRYGTGRVAAALAWMIRTRPTGTDRETASETGTPSSQESLSRRTPTAFVRLFLSIGSRDGVGPGDLLGAITGESGIVGSRIGRIDVKESFSRVEVEEGAAGSIIRALNGTTLRGRSIRADYDRGQDRVPERGADRGGERGGPSRGAPGRGGPSRGGPSRGGPGGGGSGPKGPDRGPSRGGPARGPSRGPSQGPGGPRPGGPRPGGPRPGGPRGGTGSDAPRRRGDDAPRPKRPE